MGPSTFCQWIYVHPLRLPALVSDSSTGVAAFDRQADVGRRSLGASQARSNAPRYRCASRPKNEHEVQKVMHDYLNAAFADFRSSPQIAGTLKNFKPDCGIGDIGTAVEFKFVRSRRRRRPRPVASSRTRRVIAGRGIGFASIR